MYELDIYRTLILSYIYAGLLLDLLAKKVSGSNEVLTCLFPDDVLSQTPSRSSHFGSDVFV